MVGIGCGASEPRVFDFRRVLIERNMHILGVRILVVSFLSFRFRPAERVIYWGFLFKFAFCVLRIVSCMYLCIVSEEMELPGPPLHRFELSNPLRCLPGL